MVEKIAQYLKCLADYSQCDIGIGLLTTIIQRRDMKAEQEGTRRMDYYKW